MVPFFRTQEAMAEKKSEAKVTSEDEGQQGAAFWGYI